MTPSQRSQRVYSHALLPVPEQRSRWRIGYLAEAAGEPGQIRVSRPVAHQIAGDMRALRAEALAITAQTAQRYEDAIGEVDARLPRIEMNGEHLVADWRHVTGDSDALRITDPDPDGRYTIGLDLGWQQVSPGRCDTVRDDTTCPPPVVKAYEAYVGCFTDATAALLEFAHRAGIAVAYLDRGALEADSRPLSDDEWDLVRGELYQYDEHVSATDDLNASFVDQIFSDAGVERFDDADSGSTGNATAYAPAASAATRATLVRPLGRASPTPSVAPATG